MPYYVASYLLYPYVDLEFKVFAKADLETLAYSIGELANLIT